MNSSSREGLMTANKAESVFRGLSLAVNHGYDDGLIFQNQVQIDKVASNLQTEPIEAAISGR